MTKPIEWTLSEPMPNRETHHVLRVRRYHGGLYTEINATPADLVAALAAMPVSEREEVLREFDAGDQALRCNLDMVRDQRDAETIAVLRATVRAEKAERERDEARQHFAEERETALEIRDEQRAAERERDAARSRGQDALARAEKAERERDEARLDLDRARASLEVVRHDLAGTRQELREAREDRDSLRTRLLAAESAAAAREEQTRDPLFRAHEATAAARPPREYPLAEGSRWVGEGIKSPDGYLAIIGTDQDPQLHYQSGGLGASIPLRNAAALAHRRGLV